MIPVETALHYAIKQVGVAYVYGGTGKPCTPAYRLERCRQYPLMAKSISRHCRVLSGKSPSCRGCPHAGRPAFDCAQLVKKALGSLGRSLPSGASSQWKAQVWALKMPFSIAVAREYPCVVFRRDQAGDLRHPMQHVGLSLGDGTVVDARNHQSGVLRSPLSAYPWTDLAFPQGFALPQGLPGTLIPPLSSPLPDRGLPPSLAPGDRGDSVKALQNRLLALGYPLPRYRADGIYGKETAGAVRAFQHVTGLLPDGLAGADTLARLFPKPPAPLSPRERAELFHEADEQGEG